MIYVNGELDPATPLSGAIQHFQSHAHKNALFIEVGNEGHHPLKNFSADCRESFWSLVKATSQSVDKFKQLWGSCSQGKSFYYN